MNKTAVLVEGVPPATGPFESQGEANDWCRSLPVLSAGDVVLREVRTSDALVLVSTLTLPEITRFISAPPKTAEGFERFIAASQRLRAAGEGACFAVTLRHYDTAIGLFQVRRVSPSDKQAPQLGGAIDTAEWGFAIGAPFWGTGIFEQSAALVMKFAFEQVRVHRLEARCAVKNGRGGSALLKVGAVPEGILRQALTVGDETMDQTLFAIVEEEWRAHRDQARASGLTLLH